MYVVHESQQSADLATHGDESIFMRGLVRHEFAINLLQGLRPRQSQVESCLAGSLYGVVGGQDAERAETECNLLCYQSSTLGVPTC